MANPDNELAKTRRKTLRRAAAMFIYFGVMIVMISVAFEFTLYASEGGGLGFGGIATGILTLLVGVGIGVYSFMAGRK